MISFSQEGAAKIKSEQFSEFGSRTKPLGPAGMKMKSPKLVIAKARSALLMMVVSTEHGDKF